MLTKLTEFNWERDEGREAGFDIELIDENEYQLLLRISIN